MSNAKVRFDKKPEVLRKTKVETTFEYIPILGAVLGFWRTQSIARFGTEIVVHLQHSIEHHDRLYINGVEIDISKYKKQNEN